mgnify:CR=1 FL=1
MQGRVRANRHAGAVHIVIDRADQPNNGQVRVCGGFLGSDLAVFSQFRYEAGPLLTEDIRACQRAITADDDHPVNADLDQILCGNLAPFALTERIASRRPDHCSAQLENAPH